MVFKKLAQSLKWLYVYVLNYVKTQFWWSEDKVPGPFALPIFGSLWLYTWMGPYSHDRYRVPLLSLFFFLLPIRAPRWCDRIGYLGFN